MVSGDGMRELAPDISEISLCVYPLILHRFQVNLSRLAVEIMCWYSRLNIFF